MILPDNEYIGPLFGERDLEYLKFVVESGCDAIMIHVRHSEDIFAVKAKFRETLDELGRTDEDEEEFAILAKIECTQSYLNFATP